MRHQHGWQRRARTLLVLLLPVALARAASGCFGPYCSVGKVKRWFGDLGPSANFRQAIEARAFNKEIITSIYACGGGPPVMPLSFILQMRAMGFAHVLVATNREVGADLPAHQFLLAVRPQPACTLYRLHFETHRLMGITSCCVLKP